jgi:glutathione synthase/RimK-type ligase-like ATP-grasp enzyme
MKTFDIALLTESRYLAPVNPNNYARNILTEDQLMREALERKGLRVTRVDWADPDFDWATTSAALFRTTWDYFDRFAEFTRWLEIASAKTRLINPIELIRWNMDKHYLLDLEHKGIAIPPSRIIEKGEAITLRDLHAETGWSDSVVKPTVSGGGRHTYRLQPENLAGHESIFQTLILNEAMMLQPYFRSIESRGEIALMVIGGRFSHAILKRAKEGDFRVQDDFGGTMHPYTPTPKEIEFAEHVVSVCTPQPLYARVDLMFDDNDRPAVSELEIIEPELWFRYHPAAADVLAEIIYHSM